MQVGLLPIFLLLSSSLLFSTARCDPNHHHNNQNDFPWPNLLSSLGIVIENQTSIIPNTEAHSDATAGIKEHYSSESTVEILKYGTTDENEKPVIVQNGTRNVVITSQNSNNGGLGIGYKVGIPIVSILFFICFWYCVCKCCCACCRDDSPNVVVMQQSTNIQAQQPAPQPQIVIQQPIIHQQAPPVYDASQRWAQPHPQEPPQWAQPQGPPQWGQQPPQGPQWAPHPMGQQQQYSPNSGYDNAGFNPATAPPPYNTGKY